MADERERDERDEPYEAPEVKDVAIVAGMVKTMPAVIAQTDTSR